MNRKILLLLGLVMAVEIVIGLAFAQDSDRLERTEASALDNAAESHETTSVPAAGEPQSGIEVKSTADTDNLISLNFLDVSIREVLSALALEQEINVATAHDVSGLISVHLNQVPLDEALHAVTLAGGCRFRKDGDLYYVYKPKEVRDPEEEMVQMRVFELKFAEAEKVQEILEAIPGIRMVETHEASKTIIVEDTQRNIQKVEAIVKHWDKKPAQALIEACILEVFLTDEMSLGVDWEQVLGDARIGTGGFSSAIPATAIPDTIGEVLPVPDVNISPVPDGGLGTFANFIAKAGTRRQFTAALDMLQSVTEVNTLSTPKILAVHGKAARVQVGGKQGYEIKTATDISETTTIEFIDTGIVLDITPYFDDEGNALINVRPNIQSVQLEEGIPVVNSTVVSTWAFAKSGETIFLGGLIQDTQIDQRDAIPVLGRIPLLGALFGRTVTSSRKSEFVVLITPYVVNYEMEPLVQETRKKIGEAEEDWK